MRVCVGACVRVWVCGAWTRLGHQLGVECLVPLMAALKDPPPPAMFKR